MPCIASISIVRHIPFTLPRLRLRLYSTSSSPSPSPSRLVTHHHLSGSGSDPGSGFTTYEAADAQQQTLRSFFLAWKSAPDTATIPRPHLLSFEAAPTITLGRRQTPLTPAQSSRLQAPLRVSLPLRPNPVSETTFTPRVEQTSRGGLTTYHGPGQLVLWPVLDMHSPLYPRYSVLSYAAHLEATTRRLISSVFNLSTYTTRDEPGVWVTTPPGQPERKIAAMGVHHRRHITGLGIAINIDVPVEGSEDVNPWARFVPCGLEGKMVTSVAAELAARDGVDELRKWDMASLATKWASLFEEGLVDETKRGVNGDAEDVSRRPLGG